jgi:hypothetical protein
VPVDRARLLPQSGPAASCRRAGAAGLAGGVSFAAWRPPAASLPLAAAAGRLLFERCLAGPRRLRSLPIAPRPPCSHPCCARGFRGGIRAAAVWFLVAGGPPAIARPCWSNGGHPWPPQSAHAAACGGRTCPTRPNILQRVPTLLGRRQTCPAAPGRGPATSRFELEISRPPLPATFDRHTSLEADRTKAARKKSRGTTLPRLPGHPAHHARRPGAPIVAPEQLPGIRIPPRSSAAPPRRSPPPCRPPRQPRPGSPSAKTAPANQPDNSTAPACQ